VSVVPTSTIPKRSVVREENRPENILTACGDRKRGKEWVEGCNGKKADRTPELDHFGAEWFIGLAEKDGARMARARDAINKVYSRADTLIGALDASDPTAVLSGTGGHLLPQNVANVVSIARDKTSVLPGLVMNLDLSGGTLRVPSAGSASAEMVSEGSVASQGEPTYASDMLKAQKAQVYMQASVEQLKFSAFNLMGIIGDRAGKALGALEDVEICTSDGSAPSISEAIAGGNVAEATSTVLIYEDLVTLYFSPTQVYRTNGVWLANSVTLQLLGKLMDGNDHPILSTPGMPSPVGNTPGLVGHIFGKPVYEVPLADGKLIFGDPQSYVFARAGGIEAKASTESSFTSDLVDFKFTEFFDGRILDDVGLKQMADLATVA